MDPHFENLLRLIDLEAHEQAERTKSELAELTRTEAELSGRCLLDLVVADQRSALGGRINLELRKRTENLELPWTRLDVGAPVLLSTSAGLARSVRGVVVDRDRRAIRVALSTFPEDELDEVFRIDLSRDEVTTLRERRAVERVARATSGRLFELSELFAARRKPKVSEEAPPEIARGLDETQREAVAFALAAQEVALVHGPPGTGKTRTVSEIIRGAVLRGERVLACAPSNTAVDNLVERLVAHDLVVVRLGHPARVRQQLVEWSLDVLVEQHEDVRRARRLVKDAWALRRQAEKWTRAKPAPGEKRELRAEARRLMEDARRLEEAAAAKLLDEADVLCATCSVDPAIIGQRRFDLVVIDEACQCTEPSAWIPLLHADKVVLAGDHLQLPPTVVSLEAASGGLSRSLFERILEAHGERVSRQLSVQYRMHESIMAFSNEELYRGTLVAHPSVEKHLLSDLPGVAANALTEAPITFIDTAGTGWEEQLEPEGQSRLNLEEAALVARTVMELCTAGVEAADIGVITPYAAQVRSLRELIEEAVEVDSVDGFQGREKEAILISLVRSNPDGEIGFLADERRMNVALTRARRKLIIVGDSSTIAGTPFYARMLEWIERCGGYSTVWER